MERAAGMIWPLASRPQRARWVTQAVERYLHIAWIIMSRPAAWPAAKAPFQRPPSTSRGSSTRGSSAAR